MAARAHKRLDAHERGVLCRFDSGAGCQIKSALACLAFVSLVLDLGGKQIWVDSQRLHL